MHRPDLGLNSRPKEFRKNGVRTQGRKLPSTESSEEDRTRDAAPRSVASPTHYPRSYSGPNHHQSIIIIIVVIIMIMMMMMTMLLFFFFLLLLLLLLLSCVGLTKLSKFKLRRLSNAFEKRAHRRRLRLQQLQQQQQLLLLLLLLLLRLLSLLKLK